MIYLIPKNIKTKNEIFKGFGFVELLVMALMCGIGYLLQLFTSNFYLKIFLFTFFPILTFLLLFPLPNGGNTFMFLKKFVIYQKRQKMYKYK